MEKYKKLDLTLIILSVCGVLFAGYLTFKKYFDNVCVFNESCPTFLGRPTCVYGLGIYLALLILSILVFTLKDDLRKKLYTKLVLSVSVIGIVFSGYFTIKELITCPGGNCNYTLLLPTCAYGLVMYISIAIISLYLVLKRK